MVLDANTASRQELVALVGIGEGLAEAIMLSRPFKSIDDLLAIPGIGPATLERVVEQDLAVVSSSGTGTRLVSEVEGFMPDEGITGAVAVSTLPGEGLAETTELGSMPGEGMAETTEDVDAMPGKDHAVPVVDMGMPGEGLLETIGSGAMPGEGVAESGKDMGAMLEEGMTETTIDVGVMPGEGIAAPVWADSMPGETPVESPEIGTTPGEEMAGLHRHPLATVLEGAAAGEERALTLQGSWQLTLHVGEIQS